jgi:uncharacterized protein (DUF1778 family)
MAVSSQSEPRGSEDRSLVRMNFRTKPRIKAAIQRAAALAGLDDSAFTMQAAYQAARAVISAHEHTELQPRLTPLHQRLAQAAGLCDSGRSHF